MASFNQQSAYTSGFAAGLPGMIANEEKYNAISRTIKTPAGIAFGAPAMRGTGDHECLLFATGGKYLGIAVKTMAPEHRASGTAAILDGYPLNATASLCTQGQLFILADVAVVPGDPVYYVTATGRYSNVAGASNLLIPNAKFDTTATAAGQIVEVSLGNHRVA